MTAVTTRCGLPRSLVAAARRAARRGIEPAADPAPDRAASRRSRCRTPTGSSRRTSSARAARAASASSGHKIGLTASAMQELFGVHEPDYGHLLDTMLHDAARAARPERAHRSADRGRAGVRARQQPAGARLGIADVLAATDYVTRLLRGDRFAHRRLAHPAAGHRRRQRLERARGPRQPAHQARRSGLDNLDTVLELDGVGRRDRQHQRDPRPSGQRHCLAREPTVAVRRRAASRATIVLPGTCTRSRPHRRASPRRRPYRRARRRRAASSIGAPTVPDASRCKPIGS